MKKFVSAVLAIVTVVSMAALSACGGKDPKPAEPAVSVKPVEYFQAVWGDYKDDEMFPMAGGDFDTANMEQPDVFDIEKNKDAFVSTFLVPEDVLGEITGEVATAQHMMNANTFCAAMFTVKDAGKLQTLAESHKKAVQGNQWMCGMPDTLVVLSAGDCMIVGFGADDLVKTFKDKCTGAKTPAGLILEAPAVE